MRPLTHRIYLLGQALATAADQRLGAALGLSFGEFLLLNAVAGGEAKSQGDLAACVGVGDAGVSRMVSRLVGRGLVVSRPDPDNRRRSLLALTEEGERRREAASALLERRFGERMRGVASESDRAAFEQVLNALLAAMEEGR